MHKLRQRHDRVCDGDSVCVCSFVGECSGVPKSSQVALSYAQCVCVYSSLSNSSLNESNQATLVQPVPLIPPLLSQSVCDCVCDWGTHLSGGVVVVRPVGSREEERGGTRDGGWREHSAGCCVRPSITFCCANYTNSQPSVICACSGTNTHTHTHPQTVYDVSTL